MKSFLKVVINGQSFEALDFKAGILPLFTSRTNPLFDLCEWSAYEYAKIFRKHLNPEILITIIHKMIKKLDGTHTDRSVALDISKAFDRVWHEVFQHRFSSYKVVINSHCSDAVVFNAVVSQGSLLRPTLFLIYLRIYSDQW